MRLSDVAGSCSAAVQSWSSTIMEYNVITGNTARKYRMHACLGIVMEGVLYDT